MTVADRPAPTSLDTGAGQGARIVALDALRGIAVAGIALMNVYVFALPAVAYLDPAALGPPDALGGALWALSFVFVEDKFRNLFAMLFGAGVAIMLERAGTGRLRGHYARMAALLLIGLVHATLLANNDVLRLYALAGLVLPIVAGLRPRTLFAIAALLMTAHVIAVASYLRDWLAYWWALDPAFDAQGMAEMERAFGRGADALALAMEQGRETFRERIPRRIAGIPQHLLTALAAMPSTLAAMLGGIGLWRAGILQGGSETRSLFVGAALLGIPSLVILALIGAMTAAAGFPPILVSVAALSLSAPFDLLLAIAYALVAMAVWQQKGGALRARFAAAGRLSLTNYLLTSTIFAAIFAGWGLGLFGTLSRSAALGVALLPIALMLWWSPLWLRQFRQGPFEWIWRRLAGAKPGPMRISAPRA
ncbi:DUF418 domain-containing protein [Qipengyuania sp. JC766]|uniref:DUF418 domain-containing protein n=1 Tax=Qipengyuania sp. JC766 TaxID=3232139 RepID=UPI00345A2555